MLVAKSGRDDCADLDSTLADWDGDFSPLIRKRVARHVDTCPRCLARKSAMASPLALFAGIPAFAAPAGLRERVLSATPQPSGQAVQPAPTGGSAWVRWTIMGTIAAAIVALIVVLVPGQLADGIRPAPVETPTDAATASATVPSPTAPGYSPPPRRVNPQPQPDGDEPADEDDEANDEEPEETEDPGDDGKDEPTDPRDPRRPPVVQVDPRPDLGTVEGSGEDSTADGTIR